MANFKEHIIRDGESLAGIAADYGFSINTIKQANPTQTTEPGQALVIPIKHRASPGDTRDSVAKTYGVPGVNVEEATEKTHTIRPRPAFPQYVLQSGEAIRAVAEKFGFDNQTYIAEANGIQQPVAGQIITIPVTHNIKLDQSPEDLAQIYGVRPAKVTPISDYAIILPPDTDTTFPKHLVQAGETITGIGEKYKIAAKYIAQANNLDTVLPGQIISIPIHYSLEAGESTRGVANFYDVPIDHVIEADRVVLPPTKFLEHAVQAGETMASISENYGTTTRLVSEANSTVAVKPGQILVLPVNYISRPNETAAAVASRYGVPIEFVTRHNGRILVKPNPVRFPRHLVQPDETLANIAEKYNLEPVAITETNRTDTPHQNQLLTLPAVKLAQPDSSVSALAAAYGVPVDNVVQRNNRVFIVMPTQKKSSALLPAILGLAAVILLALIGLALYQLFPGSMPRSNAQTSPVSPPGSSSTPPTAINKGDLTIVSPVDGLHVLLGSPVQVLTYHAGDDIARSELYIQQGEQEEKLVRADLPDKDGVAKQPWQPAAEGNYTVKVLSINRQNTPVAEAAAQVYVAANRAIVLSAQPQTGAAYQNQQIATPTPSACGPFSAANAPQIRLLRITNIADGDLLSVAKAGGSREFKFNPGEQLPIEFDVLNASTVAFDVIKPDGQIQTITFEQPANKFAVSLDQLGQYKILMRAAGVTGCWEQQVVVANVDAKIVQVAEPPVIIPPSPSAMLVPTPTPTRFFEPPPPIPGVPPGPTQDQVFELRPPVCDAADLLGVFTPSSGKRIEIKEDDMVPAKTVGGATVFRSWRLQNTGTCTWGPGYELAFYGGRTMGSGGVSFENTWPSEPGRRNIVVDGNRLIVPEGKPNQVAVVEVMLQAPVTPGIHQSYWRMRNPQGVYFGPIMGVTLEVVRECQFGIYGAPTINKFEILGVGNVYLPTNPMQVEAEQGENVTLDWNVINATNVDIVLEGPTGEIQTLSSGDAADRAVFTPNRLGRYTLTMYADNGPCTVSAVVYVDVIPREDDPNAFIMESAQTGNISEVKVSWNHQDTNVNGFTLVAQTYKRASGTDCWFGLDANQVWSWAQSMVCNSATGWVAESGSEMPYIYGIAQSQGVSGASAAVNLPDLTPEDNTLVIGISGNNETEIINRGTFRRAQLPWNGRNEGWANIKNVMWGLCPANATSDYRVFFSLAGYVNGKPASPQVNTTSSLEKISVSCDPYSKSTSGTFGAPPAATSTPAVILPREIPDDSGQQ